MTAEPLHILENSLLELPLDLLSRLVRCRLSVETEEGTQVEFR
jgi:hypothetical protein